MSKADLVFDLVRPDDHCCLKLRFYNVRAQLVADGGIELVPRETGPVRVVLELPAQHVAEEAFHEAEDPAKALAQLEEALKAPLRTAMAGPSVLVWALSESHFPLRLTSKVLFGLLQETSPVTDVGSRDEPMLRARPEATSFFELPQGLFLVPQATKGGDRLSWPSPTRPRTDSDPYTATAELWRIELPAPLLLSAVYAHPVATPRDPLPSGRALPRNRREMIWRPMGDAAVPYGWQWAVWARRLRLSALGADFDLRGEWLSQSNEVGGPDKAPLESWVQRGTLGRDHYVRAVTKGTLFPLGHAAVLIQITQRRFVDSGGYSRPALLRTRQFIVLRQPWREYASADFPFTRIHVLTEITPDLASVADAARPFWPASSVSEQDLLFDIEGEDLAGATLRWRMPLCFVPSPPTTVAAANTHEQDMRQLLVEYAFSPRAETSFGSQALTYARRPEPTTADEQGRLRTSMLSFGAKRPVPAPPGYAPWMARAAVELDALAALTQQPGRVSIAYNGYYLGPHGLDSATNPTGVFATLVDPAEAAFDKAVDRVGGLAAPSFAVTALSLDLGPVGGAIDASGAVAGLQGQDAGFDPKKFFAGLLGGAKLLGAIDLTDVIATALGSTLDAMPRLLSQTLTEGAALIQRSTELQRDIQGAIDSLGQEHELAQSLASIEAELGMVVPQLEKAVLGDPAYDIVTVATQLGGRLGAVCDAVDRALGGLATAGAVAAGADAKPISAPTQRLLDARRVLERLHARARELQARVGGEAIDALIQAIAAVREQRVTFEWTPELQSYSTGSLSTQPKAEDFLFYVGMPPEPGKPKPPPEGRFRVQVELRTRGGQGTEAGLTGLARLEKFSLHLVPPLHLITLRFKHIGFSLRAGSSPEIDVAFEPNGIEFRGPLRFVELLSDFIPGGGFSDPPALDVTAEGITASFSLGLPNVEVGVFALKNLTLGARLNLPFIGSELQIGFDFCQRHSPFLLTISCFGGGGYFGIMLGPSGLRSLEAAFEFGASIDLSVGIASGEVHVMGGVHYKLERSGTSTKAVLTAYLRMGGSLDVLGIVSVSMELTLQLAYDVEKDKLWGRAKLVLGVRVLFFKKTFEVEVERRLSGSANDPTFTDMMQPYTLPAGDPSGPRQVDPWAVYCGAFAGSAAAAPARATEIGVDTNALSVATLQLVPVRPHGFAPGPAWTFAASPGELTITFPLGGDPIPWSVAPDGTVAYAPRLEGLLAGHGTHTLTVRGHAITVDITALSAQLFMVYGARNEWRPASPPPSFVLPPGSTWRIQLPSGVIDIPWIVTEEGTIDYEPRWDGFLGGRGTETLVVRGRRIEIDATALTSGALMVIGLHTSWVPAREPVRVDVLPGTYGVQTYAGVSAIRWSVTAAGIEIVAGASAGVSSEGDRLRLTGVKVFVDARALTSNLLMIVGVHTGWADADAPIEITALPGRYGLQTLAGVSGLGWTIEEDGTVSYPPELQGVLDRSEDRRTLVVRGHTLHVDLTGTDADLVMITGVHTGWVPGRQTLTLTLLPGSYGFQFLWGFAAARFTVTRDGELEFAATDATVLDRRGDDTLVVRIPKP